MSGLNLIGRRDPWDALRLGAEAAHYLPLVPEAWVALAEHAGMEPTYCPPHGKRRGSVMLKVDIDDPERRALADFLRGWMNTRPREEFNGVTDLLRLCRRGGSRGRPLDMPREIVRAARYGVRLGSPDLDDRGYVAVRIDPKLLARLTGMRWPVPRKTRALRRKRREP